jgi:hypothetical protein
MEIQFCDLNKYELDFEKIDELWEDDYGEACRAVMRVNKSAKSSEIEEYAVKNGNLAKYLINTIYPSKGAGYWMVEDGKMEAKKGDGWEKIKDKIKCKSELLYKLVIKDCKGLYSADVYGDESIVDQKKRRINLALPMNFTYTESKKKSKNGEKVLSFMKEVICSNEGP